MTTVQIIDELSEILMQDEFQQFIEEPEKMLQQESELFEDEKFGETIYEEDTNIQKCELQTSNQLKNENKQFLKNNTNAKFEVRNTDFLKKIKLKLQKLIV